mmetsp:Transcript_34232/g.41370  ORF Transcript_34232/g.41370 Transcript_34232/m.41370 type:complete len:172 (+) Transcript_34232:153-668(+)|eukprot:CAMPEP_0197862668 /NCGR_PEP_ID=MMETSP1438-20131217/39625_1 /TAXON_ID=1461541 /ORGANISM="Pterosperma sp., Strain CCMP1384" /LENGTH=171 /DNA_ID=CAMNT_0043480313 /DNA_START=134 /DNA_END=649 /DNA_ORIENTATION=-
MSGIALKFGALAVKTLSKPLANGCKSYAKNNPLLRDYLVAFARRKHDWNFRLEQGLRADGSPRYFAGRLSEDKALAEGADFLGEAIVFGVASGVMVWEYRRSSAKDEAAKEKERRRKAKVKDALETINMSLGDLKDRIALLEGNQAEVNGKLDDVNTLVQAALLNVLEKGK